MSTYSIEFDQSTMNDPNAMKALSDFFDAVQESEMAEVRGLANELGVSMGCACDVRYLRTRSRWTEELEEELIRLHKAGTPPNVMEFGSPYALSPVSV